MSVIPTVSADGVGVVSAGQLNAYEISCYNVGVLRTVVGQTGMSVFLQGTNTPNDGGQGNFYWDYTSTATDNNYSVIRPYGVIYGAWLRTVISSTISGDVSNATVIATGATTARTLANYFADILNVKDFGAYGDALHDDTAAIQAAINYAATIVAAGNGGRGINIWLPAGEYLVSNTITVISGYVGIIGDGAGRTLIARNAAYGDTILFNNGAIIYNCAVRGITFYHDTSVGNAMTGAHIRALAPLRFVVDDCVMQNGAYGVTLEGGVYVYINNVHLQGHYISGSVPYNSLVGFYFVQTTNTGAVPLPTIVNVTNCQMNTSGVYTGYEYGTVINACEEMHFTNCTFNGGILSEVFIQQTSSASNILEVTFNSCFFDTFDETYAVFITALASTDDNRVVSRIRFQECGFNGESDTPTIPPGNGLYVIGRNANNNIKVFDVQVIGCTFQAFYQDAIVIEGGNFVNISSNTIYDNNQSNNATSNGITLTSGVNKIKINDNIIGGIAGSTSKQRYGISVASNVYDFTIENNDVTNNTTGGINDLSTTTNKRITNNLGFNGNRSAASPTLPATTVDYTNPYGSPAVVSIFGGTVSDIKLNGTTISSATNIILNVGANDVLRLTYSSAPSWIWWPQ